jgi:hypothetical protein
MYEDNAACIAQMRSGYIKSDLTKHMSPKLFYPHQLQKVGEIEILQTKSCDNLVDLFTKSLPTSLFQKYVFGIGMRQLKDLQESGETIFDVTYIYNHQISLPFFLYEFFLTRFLIKRFNETITIQNHILYHLNFPLRF